MLIILLLPLILDSVYLFRAHFTRQTPVVAVVSRRSTTVSGGAQLVPNSSRCWQPRSFCQIHKDELKRTKPESPNKCPKVLSKHKTKTTQVQLVDRRNLRTMGLQKDCRTRHRMRLTMPWRTWGEQRHHGGKSCDTGMALEFFSRFG